MRSLNIEDAFRSLSSGICFFNLSKLDSRQAARLGQIKVSSKRCKTDTMGMYKFISSLHFLSYFCMHSVLNSFLSSAVAGSTRQINWPCLNSRLVYIMIPLESRDRGMNPSLLPLAWCFMWLPPREDHLELKSLKLGCSISPRVGNLSFVSV